MTEVSRRTVIKATGAISAAMLPAGAAIGTTNTKEPEVARPIATRSICAAAAASNTDVFFNSEEAAFIEAAVARLIPADEEWPGAFEACVPNYIDKQLRFFADRASKKWPLRGSLKESGVLVAYLA
jgi:gluconate 2-dehydrogenase gamma chain